MAINKDSAGYILGFSLGVCLVCSLGVSAAYILLKDKQDVNAEVAKQEKILDVAGLVRPGEKLTTDQVQKLYAERLIPVLVDLKTGELLADANGVPAGEFDMMGTAKAANAIAEPNEAKVRFQPEIGLLYYQVDDKGLVKKIIIPIEGYGLWGFLFGYIALEGDGETISGITYYKHAETPGLGGEVDNPNWKGSWKGKKAFAPGKPEVAIQVVKNASGDYEIDSLSGATITSRGVSNMMAFWLGDHGFGKFLQKVREGGPPQPIGAKE
ncbi:Na(+)-translocating NADH-quinone reductase subunit C [Nannocystaceae bacterium ST9]